MAEVNMEAVFNQAQETVATTKSDDDKKAAKKAAIAEMQAIFQKQTTEDPTLTEKLSCMSENFEVVKALGFGEKGNIVVDKEKSTKDNRVLGPTSKIIGYKVKNNGPAVQVTTDKCVKGDDGKWTAEKVQVTWASGAEMDLSRENFTLWASQVEISFKLANGKVIPGSSSSNKSKSASEMLASFYFTFDKATGKNVNDDETKEKIDENGIVKPEYEETFGVLNNKPDPKTRKGGSKKKKIESNALMAARVREYVKQA